MGEWILVFKAVLNIGALLACLMSATLGCAFVYTGHYQEAIPLLLMAILFRGFRVSWEGGE